jgi:hypothetical protein
MIMVIFGKSKVMLVHKIFRNIGEVPVVTSWILAAIFLTTNNFHYDASDQTTQAKSSDQMDVTLEKKEKKIIKCSICNYQLNFAC